MSEMGLISEGAGPSTFGSSLSAKEEKACLQEVSDSHDAGGRPVGTVLRNAQIDDRKTVFYS
jgi:hypothetical protein